MSERFRKGLERGSVLVLLAGAVLVFLSWVRTMAETSLWNDEIYTILKFSSQGVRRVLSDYHAPNNHVFFNLVNALLPASSSMEPLRARGLSILAVGAALLLVFRIPARRGMPFAGSVATFLLAANGTLLELVLQARGYGLLFFLSAALAALVPWSLDREDRRGLALTAAVVAAGTCTVPTFVFFGGAWLLGLVSLRRDREALLACAGAAAAVALLYLPLLTQILAQHRTYGAQWGREYGVWAAAGETVQRYVLPPGPAGVPFPLGLATALPLLLAAWSLAARGTLPDDERALVRLCALSSLAFLVACRALGTPLIRTTSFVGPPLLLAGAVLSSRWAARRVPPAALRAGPLLAVALVASLARPMRPSRFLPIEEWRGVSQLLDTTFPPELPVHVSWSGDFLEAHAASGRRTTVPFDEAAFARGEQLLFDDTLDRAGRLGARRLLAPSASIRFLQQRSEDGFTELRFAPPAERLVEALETEAGVKAGAEAFDRDFTSGWTEGPAREASGGWLVVDLVPGNAYRSLVVVLGAGEARAERGWVTFDGGWASLPAAAVETRGALLLVHLGDRPVRSVHLDLGPPREGERVVEVWAYRSRR